MSLTRWQLYTSTRGINSHSLPKTGLSMPKTRFTAADVRAVVRDLRSTVHGLRVVNVYDLDAKVSYGGRCNVLERRVPRHGFLPLELCKTVQHSSLKHHGCLRKPAYSFPWGPECIAPSVSHVLPTQEHTILALFLLQRTPPPDIASPLLVVNLPLPSIGRLSSCK